MKGKCDSLYKWLKPEIRLINIYIQSVPHRKHITSPLQNPTG
jgi:hypothetical protein